MVDQEIKKLALVNKRGVNLLSGGMTCESFIKATLFGARIVA